jgi:hypothetical protein
MIVQYFPANKIIFGEMAIEFDENRRSVRARLGLNYEEDIQAIPNELVLRSHDELCRQKASAPCSRRTLPLYATGSPTAPSHRASKDRSWSADLLQL